MSELSVLQHEYERLSTILRRLNRLIIDAADNPKGFRLPIAERDELVHQLEYLRDCAAAPAGRVGDDNWFADALEHTSPNARSSFHRDVERVVSKLRDHSAQLSSIDIDIASQMAAALDTASALLFRRMQPQ